MWNNVLRSFAPRDCEALQSRMRTVKLAKGALLAQPGDDMHTVYFPQDGIVSLLVVLQDGSEVQTSMVGADGVIGAAQALDDKKSLNKIVAQTSGTATTVDRDVFRLFAADRLSVRQTIAAHEQFIVADIQQTAACNAKHNIAQRCCRWLMRMRDLCGNEFPMTQDCLAGMIGVRRTSVTTLASELRSMGALSYSRGQMRITDAERLQAVACECHEAVQHNYETLFGRQWPRAADAQKPGYAARKGKPSGGPFAERSRPDLE